MKEAKTKDLWVFVETEEDGSAKKVGLELLTPGRDLADKQGGKIPTRSHDIAADPRGDALLPPLF